MVGERSPYHRRITGKRVSPQDSLPQSVGIFPEKVKQYSAKQVIEKDRLGSVVEKQSLHILKGAIRDTIDVVNLAITQQIVFGEQQVCLSQGAEIGITIADIDCLGAFLTSEPQVQTFAIGATAAALSQIGKSNLQTSVRFDRQSIGANFQIRQPVLAKNSLDIGVHAIADDGNGQLMFAAAATKFSKKRIDRLVDDEAVELLNRYPGNGSLLLPQFTGMYLFIPPRLHKGPPMACVAKSGKHEIADIVLRHGAVKIAKYPPIHRACFRKKTASWVSRRRSQIRICGTMMRPPMPFICLPTQPGQRPGGRWARGKANN